MTTENVALFEIKVNGSLISTDLMTQLQSVEVDSSLHMPSAATVEFYDKRIELTDNASLFKVGDDLAISARSNAALESSAAADTLFEGVIAAIEPVFAADAAFYTRLVIRAYDRLYLLHRGSGSKTFQNQKDSDIVAAVTREAGAGLSVSSDDTTVVHPHVFRDDCSDYEFLQMLAARNGYVLQCDGATLNFKKPDNLGAEEVSLAFGEGLREFRPALSLVGQVGEVQVGGWDRAQKRAVTGRSTAAKFASAETSFNRGYSIITSAHSARTFHITAPTPTQASADGQASAALDRMAASDLTAEGIAYGNPAIKPGGKVHITKLGSRFSGKYFVTRVRHRFSPDEAYTTEFWVGGMSSGTLASLVSPVAPAAAVAQPRTLPGLYTALVTNNKDPENQGRVKVKFPQIAEGNESNWAPVASVGAGAQRGLFVLPEVNDEVLVGFLHGDINYPVVLAGLWNGKDKPPDTTPTASTVDVRTFKSRKGHFLRITDEDGKEKIEVTDKSAKNHFTIDITKKSIAIMAEQDVTIEAKGDVKIKGTNVKIEGTAKVDANGPVFQAEGKTQLVLKGAAAELTATGQAKISGGMVMIN